MWLKRKFYLDTFKKQEILNITEKCITEPRMPLGR